jgi:hypothetical protein
VAAAGDLDADGVPDLLLASTGYDGNRGAGYVLFGHDVMHVCGDDRLEGGAGDDGLVGVGGNDTLMAYCFPLIFERCQNYKISVYLQFVQEHGQGAQGTGY